MASRSHLATDDLTDLDRRVVSAADALHRREVAFRRDVTLDRDDVRQIAREAALETLQREPSATVSYVVTACHWRILDTFRRDRRDASRRSGIDIGGHDDDEPTQELHPSVDPAEETVEKLATASEYVAAVWLAVWLLPEAQRDVLLLRAEGYTPAEIAERLRISPGAVKSRTNRARARIFTLRQETHR